MGKAEAPGPDPAPPERNPAEGYQAAAQGSHRPRAPLNTIPATPAIPITRGDPGRRGIDLGEGLADQRGGLIVHRRRGRRMGRGNEGRVSAAKGSVRQERNRPQRAGGAQKMQPTAGPAMSRPLGQTDQLGRRTQPGDLGDLPQGDARRWNPSGLEHPAPHPSPLQRNPDHGTHRDPLRPPSGNPVVEQAVNGGHVSQHADGQLRAGCWHPCPVLAGGS